MKRGMKAALWTAAGCIAVGGILVIAGWAAGGFSQVDQVDDWKHWGIHPVKWNGAEWNGKEAKKGADIYSGDFSTEISYTGKLKDLEVEIGVHDVRIEEGSEEAIYLEGENCDRIQCYVEEGRLYLKDVEKHTEYIHSDGREMTLTLPKGIIWEKAKLEAAMGYIEMDELQAKDADLKAGMGAITLHHALLTKLDASADMGSIELSGAIDGNVDAKANMGSVVLNLTQERKDFNYQIESTMGSIVLDGDEYAGMSKEMNLRYDAPRNMELEADMGSIEITFE